MRPLILALFLLAGCCCPIPVTNTTQTIWEPTIAATCDHRNTKCCCDDGARSLAIEFREPEAIIIGVTTYYKGGHTVLVWHREVSNKLNLRNMFPEGLHHQMLQVKILVAYKGRIFEIPVFCNIKPL